jgi:hypothetical protein
MCDTLETRAFFIHEMTHVWQNQTGCISAFNNLREEMLTLAGGDLYAYNPLENKKFQSYRCEQQASMMQDFYAASGVAALDAAGVKDHGISYPMAGNWKLNDLASKILPVFPHFTVPAPL